MERFENRMELLKKQNSDKDDERSVSRDDEENFKS